MDSSFVPLQVSSRTEPHVILAASLILATVPFAMAAFVLTVALVSRSRKNCRKSSCYLRELFGSLKEAGAVPVIAGVTLVVYRIRIREYAVRQISIRIRAGA